MKGSCVKKGEVFKGRVNQDGAGGAVNNVIWARQASVNPDCQNRVDVKALTGRGTLANLRQEVAKIDELVSKMSELVQLTKSINGLGIYLVLHQRTSSGYVFLRWRERLGSNRHLNWDDVADLTRGQSPEVRKWCQDTSAYAQELNAMHLRSREAIKRIRKQVQHREPHLFQRNIF